MSSIRSFTLSNSPIHAHDPRRRRNYCCFEQK